MQSALATITAILNANIRLGQQLDKYYEVSDCKTQNAIIDDEEIKDDAFDDLPLYSLREVSFHCSMDDCWIVIKDRVYDVTNFLSEHPAGADIILENAGRDATNSFNGVSHSKDAHILLKEYCIGTLIDSERIYMNNILPS